MGLDRVDSVAALVARLDAGGTVPARVVFDHVAEPASSDGSFLAATHAVAERALSELQFILSEARLNETSVAWLTCGAVATGPEEGVAGLSRAPLWGLVRSARAEHPDRQLQLLDVDAQSRRGGFAGEAVVDGSGAGAGAAAWLGGGAAAGACGVGGGCTSGAHRSGGLPSCGHSPRSELDGVSLVAAPELLSEPLEPGQVRVSVRAAGMNFRDVLIALGDD